MFIRFNMIHEREKIAVFTYRSPHFCFPWRRPCDYHAICCMDGMERQFDACQTDRCMYLSIFNSFRVKRCVSQCVSPKIAIFTTFLFPLGTTLGQSRSMLYGWKENSMLTNCLAACTPLSSTVSQLFEPQVQKIAVFTYRTAHIFVSPADGPATHAICCMDGKTIQCLSNASQHVPIYLQQFPSYSNRKCKQSPFSRTAAHIFVSPRDAPAIITQHVAWMERQFNACQTYRSMYLSIFNSFRVIRC